jgi:hypothetical protein
MRIVNKDSREAKTFNALENVLRDQGIRIEFDGETLVVQINGEDFYLFDLLVPQAPDAVMTIPREFDTEELVILEPSDYAEDEEESELEEKIAQ